MKRTSLLSLVFLTLAAHVGAQSVSPEQAADTISQRPISQVGMLEYIFKKPVTLGKPTRNERTPWHHLVSIGVGTIADDDFFYSFNVEPECFGYFNSDCPDSPMELYNNSKYRWGDPWIGAVYDASYHLRISRCWYLGLHTGYHYESRPVESILENRKVMTETLRNWYVMPSVRWYYRDTPSTRWYGEFGLGTCTQWTRKWRVSSTQTTHDTAVHITLLGYERTLTHGLFLYGEYGVGFMGLLRCGMGYRF